MSAIYEPAGKPKVAAPSETLCYHCGTPCITTKLSYGDKAFCCDGCRLVYELLNANGLCNYYDLEQHPGLGQVKSVRQNKYDYLDEAEIAKSLYQFTDGQQAVITFFIPAIHCSSCMWLLENLHRLRSGIIDSRINFSAKEVTIRFRCNELSLRQLVELLATIGYEPRITLDGKEAKPRAVANKARLYKLGVAGFCFGNIMLMSLPEYFSGEGGMEHRYAMLFRIMNLILSVPVVFYAAGEFFATAWAGIKQKLLNIDAPIVLAILITYGRSLYEIFSGTGGGYLDSMSGIVFFMLVGRVVQERVYNGLSLHRDYKAYFPIAATIVGEEGIGTKNITALQRGDVVRVYHQEVIPADGRLIKGAALIDYSFVSGESNPVAVATGEKLYAGGRQVGEALEMQVMQPITSSYLTSLWSHQSFKKDKTAGRERDSFIHLLSKHFSIVLFALAFLTAVYWWIVDAAMVLPSVSAMLIVACPCALLLTATYTNGNVLRILSDNGLYLRDANVIEQLSALTHLVFDKTGTLTEGTSTCYFKGAALTKAQLQAISEVVKQSAHPKSRQLAAQLGHRPAIALADWKEIPGKGLEAHCNGAYIKVGSRDWTGAADAPYVADLYINIDGQLTGVCWKPKLRSDAPQVLKNLARSYHLSLLSGDYDRERAALEPYFHTGYLLFEQQPVQKLQFIENLQSKGERVAMIGDGLNDAGALQQSEVGIMLADDINNFSPACDAILQAQQMKRLPAMLALARKSKSIIYASFIVSVLYNTVGLLIAMSGNMNPMIAAILMPLSTLTIVLITTGASNILAARLGLHWREATDDHNHFASKPAS